MTADARGFGRIESDGSTRSLVFGRRLDANPDEVWRAPTAREQLAAG